MGKGGKDAGPEYPLVESAAQDSLRTRCSWADETCVILTDVLVGHACAGHPVEVEDLVRVQFEAGEDPHDLGGGEGQG